jgi:multiple antibiotic resistance protein
LFVALTAGMSRGERAQIGIQATITSFLILLLFAVAGTAILRTFGITIHAFRIAGGLLLFHIAFEMIFEKRSERKTVAARRAMTVDEIRHIAIFPLAIPLIAGPGAISATILLSGTFSSALERAALIAIIAAILGITFIVFRLAERIEALLGVTGRIVLTRLLGVILAALAVQFVADGVLALAATLPR